MSDSKSVSIFHYPTFKPVEECLNSTSALHRMVSFPPTFHLSPNKLKGGCFYELPNASKIRYSGSDIAVIVLDALMQPVRKVLSATHFKQASHFLSSFIRFRGLPQRCQNGSRLYITYPSFTTSSSADPPGHRRHS